MSLDPKHELREFFVALAKDAEQYFVAAAKAVPTDSSNSWSQRRDFYWGKLPRELCNEAYALIDRLVQVCALLGELARASTLTGSEDLHDIKIATKSARAALRLRDYSYRGPEAIRDEGTVLGFTPAQQSENGGLSPIAADAEFFKHLSTLEAVLSLTETTVQVAQSTHALPEPAKYRAGTAFIMMWMDPSHPELTDVADTVRAVFDLFEVRGLRADDIEHEGLITERILNEIRTSEFLFADLTGMRPNVYYEIGYAHALGKRVILFRKSGTGLHFDLAGYNCPEYENLRDLRDKLTKRLVSLTNRNPCESTST